MTHLLNFLPNLAFGAPFLIIVVILLYHSIRSAIWNWTRRGERPANVYRCSAALGFILLFVQVFYQPSESSVMEVQQEEDAEQDDQADPDQTQKAISQQLKRIRRGQPVENLTVRL